MGQVYFIQQMPPRFRDANIRGEWFAATDELIEFICKEMHRPAKPRFQLTPAVVGDLQQSLDRLKQQEAGK